MDFKKYLQPKIEETLQKYEERQEKTKPNKNAVTGEDPKEQEKTKPNKNAVTGEDPKEPEAPFRKDITLTLMLFSSTLFP